MRGSGSTTAEAINLGGTIVGSGSNLTAFVSTGFPYDGGTVTPIIPPGAVTSQPNGINLEGVIVGDYNTRGITLTTTSIPPSIYGFIDDHGQYTTLNDPNGAYTIASGINAFGTAVGTYYLLAPFNNVVASSSGFAYDYGTYTTISAPGAQSTSARSINDFGEVGGSVSFLGGGTTYYIYDHGTYTTILPPGGRASQLSTAINNRGELVKSYTTSGPIPNNTGEMGFIYDHGTYTSLAAPGATNTTAISLNNLGAVVGTYTNSSSEHAFVYANGTFTNIDVPGASATDPEAINDLGQIVGHYYDSSGSHGFVTTPQGPSKIHSFLSDLAGDLSKFHTALTDATSTQSWTKPIGTIHGWEADASATCSHPISSSQIH